MSYKLKKPYTDKQRIDFTKKYQYGYALEETESALYALEANEIMSGGVPIVNPDYEAEQAQKERERLNMLSLTAADVERAIYKDKGMDFEDVIEFVKNVPSIDIKALKIELKANNFYRGNPYVGVIGNILGYSSDDLDYLFENKELPKEEEQIDNSTDIHGLQQPAENFMEEGETS